MSIHKRLAQALVVGMLAFGASDMAYADKQGRNTVIGAGLGGVAGALLSEGDPWMTIGGAAAGGVLGHVITRDDDRRDRRGWDRGDRKRDHYRHNNDRRHHAGRGNRHHRR